MLPSPRRIAPFFAAASLALGALAPALAHAQYADLRVNTSEPRYTAIVLDATTGEVLYEKRADSPRYPASISKVMTMYLAFEQLASGKLKPTDMITVSAHAASMSPTKLGLRPGDTISVDDALHAMAVKSANDMAVAVAEKIGGSEERFAAMMTLRAHELGMTNSRFVNASGLPDSRQISSARDLATLSRAVLRDYPQYYRYFSQESFVFRGREMSNHNHLLGNMPGVDGLKTGFTSAAGYNLAASGVRNNHRLIAVVMGGTTWRARDANVENLLLTGFDIEDRRDRGEHIMLTQALFEQGAPAAPTTMLASAAKPQPAAGEVDPIDVVLTRSTNAPPQLTVSGSMAAATAPRSGLSADTGRAGGLAAQPPARAQRVREARNWSVQVGAFRSEREARRQVEQVADRFAVLGNAEGSVDGGGRSYRARFSGLTETAARDACETVKAKGVPCVASGPR
ncbi:MAG TPA: D-alanyl-D-alanine carboxypeptidase [Caulobacteraceae bacterium]|nr:D-alanyl-D-alanine carboxypeptidase [Caulobacteraceae bacterium]